MGDVLRTSIETALVEKMTVDASDHDEATTLAENRIMEDYGLPTPGEWVSANELDSGLWKVVVQWA